VGFRVRNSISLEKYWGFEKHASIGPDFGPLALKLHTDVKAGVELSFLATSGKVDIDYPTHVVVDVPAPPIAAIVSPSARVGAPATP
jgi:hypothetical protein